MFNFENADLINSTKGVVSVDDVNRLRENLRIREQLPTSRDRFAFGVRVAKRFPNATLRVEERIYKDSWGIKASTTDGRYVLDLGKNLRVWPHLRFHYQTAATFYRKAYSIERSEETDPNTKADAFLSLPLYRTGDRELGSLTTITAGGGARWALSAPEAKTQWALLFQSDGMYSIYPDLLFMRTRKAIYGTIGVEAEFE
jgi:hypothetical protein